MPSGIGREVAMPWKRWQVNTGCCDFWICSTRPEARLYVEQLLDLPWTCGHAFRGLGHFSSMHVNELPNAGASWKRWNCCMSNAFCSISTVSVEIFWSFGFIVLVLESMGAHFRFRNPGKVPGIPEWLSYLFSNFDFDWYYVNKMIKREIDFTFKGEGVAHALFFFKLTRYKHFKGFREENLLNQNPSLTDIM